MLFGIVAAITTIFLLVFAVVTMHPGTKHLTAYVETMIVMWLMAAHAMLSTAVFALFPRDFEQFVHPFLAMALVVTIGLGFAGLARQLHAASSTRLCYKRATLALATMEKFANDSTCKTAQQLLSTCASDEFEFTAGVDSEPNSRTISPVFPIEGKIRYIDTFEVALALDLRTNDRCFWRHNDLPAGYIWQYHREVKEAILTFAKWLSLSSVLHNKKHIEVLDGEYDPVAVLRPFGRLFNHSTWGDGTRHMALMRIKLLFVWRSLLLRERQVAALLEPIAFEGTASGKCPLATVWLGAICHYPPAAAKFKGMQQLPADATIDDCSDVFVDITRLLLEFLLDDRLLHQASFFPGTVKYPAKDSGPVRGLDSN